MGLTHSVLSDDDDSIASSDGRDDGTIDSELRSAIFSRNWAWAERCLRDRPTIAFGVDRDGDTVLHLCSMVLSPSSASSAPLPFVKRLLALHPAAAASRNKQGATPLHYACRRSVDDGVLSAILEACPEAATAVDEDGEVPLYRVRSARSAALVLETDPEGVSRVDRRGISPLTHICAFCVRFICGCCDDLQGLASKTVIFGDLHPRIEHVSDATFSTGGRPYGTLKDAWDIATLFVRRRHLQLGNEEMADAERTPAVHAAIACDGCNIAFCRRAVEMLPGDIRKRDSRGNLPLHVAANMMKADNWKRRTRVLGVTSEWTARKGTRRWTDLLEVYIAKSLLPRYPGAAKELNYEGKYPLNVMNEAGATWRSGMAPILDAHPPALHALAVEEGLIPRALAKVGKDCSFGTMYELLRDKPDIIKHAQALRRSGRKRKRTAAADDYD